jgi:hypothetical protein
MNLTEFNQQNFDQRCETVWNWGFYICRQPQGDINKVLYAINNFYAEVTISVSDNSILEVTGLSKEDLKEKEFYVSIENHPFVSSLLYKKASGLISAE